MSEPNHRRRPGGAPARSRSITGKPLTLIIGWVLSCALVTAVTLFAVGRVGHEISGNQPQVITEQQVIGKLNQTPTPVVSPAAASNSVASPAPTTAKPTTSATSGGPQKSPSSSPSASQPRVKPTESPSKPSHPPSITPPAPDKPSSPSAQPTVTPTTTPTQSPTGSPTTSPSVSGSPVGSPVTHKTTAYVPGGSITVLCVGDSIYQAAVTISDSKYTLDTKSTNNPKVDVIFTTGTTSTEYVYSCAAGQLVGGPVAPEHTG